MATVIDKPLIASELLEAARAAADAERQVIVHCCFPAAGHIGSLIRIWKSTYLVDHESDGRSALVHAENITLYPWWTEILPFHDYWFTLVFTGLPSSCKMFDLQEIIPQEGGFNVKNILRNNSDIYRIKIS